MNELIEFTNLLHKHGSGDAPEVRKYLEERGKNDPTFRVRAEAVLLGFATRAVPSPAGKTVSPTAGGSPNKALGR